MSFHEDRPARQAKAIIALLALVKALAFAPAATAQQTAVPTRLEVTGTAASATLTWQPVDGAMSYSVKRWKQDDLKCCYNSVKGLEATRWTDSGLEREGFPQPGVYVFELTAQLKDTAEVAVINWTLPAAAPVKTLLRVTKAVAPASLRSMAGPAPQNVRVLPGGPMIHTLMWDRAPGNAGYNVFRHSSGPGEWTPANSAPILDETFPDTNIVLPGSRYRVTALYADGRQGSTDFVYANPPPLQVPTGLQALKIAPGMVRIWWQRVPFAKGYLVIGSGTPPEGTLLAAYPGEQQAVSISNLPDGTYSWRVTADYGGAYQTAGMPTASITLAALAAPPVDPPPLPARFRVSILGFKAIVETNDDQLSRDGSHNEVYAAAYVCEGIRPTRPPYDPQHPVTYNETIHQACHLVRSAVHGDVNNFSDRVRAGSGSGSGGIATGDAVGSGPSGATAGSTSTFPFLLWEGTMLPEKEAVWIAPSLWERGGSDIGLHTWATHVVGSMGTMYAQYSLGGGFVLQRIKTTPCGFDFTSDRPIGIAPPVGYYHPGPVCNVIGLTREKAEAVLRGAPQEAGNPVGVLTVDLPDYVSGHYVMYLKLERLP